MVWGEFPGKAPLPGVSYQFEFRSSPPVRIYVLTIDLANPRVAVVVSRGGPDPDGDGRFQTTLMRPTEIAEREGFDLVVNGDFFSIKEPEGEDNPGPRYSVGRWSSVAGAAMTGGQRWSAGDPLKPCLVITRARKALVALGKDVPAGAAHVMGGNTVLVENGKKLPKTNQDLHPRTVAGVDATGTKITLLVVDGRSLGSRGMSYDELADEMVRLGCATSINLDGGGSTTLAMRHPETGKMTIVNKPSDGRERPVANVLGVKVIRDQAGQ